MNRPDGRQYDQLRNITLTPHFTKYAEGSVLIECGNTQVICNASVSDGVPSFLKGKHQGWLTAEYGMLPRSTHTRMRRESATKTSGRTLEIQRLIGRSLRACLNLSTLGERTITVDCDVIQADGGTRTAAITGGYVALTLALKTLQQQGAFNEWPILFPVAATSVGIVQDQAMLDLNYAEDSQAQTDMNVVMTATGDFVEIQGTAEKTPFTSAQLTQMLPLATTGIKTLIDKQDTCIKV